MLVCLAAASPVLPQEEGPPSPQVAQPEWQTLLKQAITTFNAEFYKSDGAERNYKPVFVLLDQAERSAKRQFGAGSDPHIAVLHMRAVYLGLTEAYDKQLELSKQLLKYRTAGVDPNSLSYAKALIQQVGEITYYNDEHKLFGAQTLLQANKIMSALGPVNNDDLADAWYM